MTLMPYVGVRDVKSVLYMLLRRQETKRHTHSERLPV